MDYQQPHRYMRPPPAPPPQSVADPHHQLFPRQTVPPPGQWYSGQFQYQNPPQHSPLPPPPSSQWAPPPPYTDYNHYAPPPPPPPSHPYFLPPHPPPNQYSSLPPPPPPPPHSQFSQAYPQASQDWGDPSLGHHQGWEYPASNNEEDWAAKARAWAAAKAATDNQHPQTQFAPTEQSNYQDQYQQNVEPHYADVQHPPVPASSYQQYPAAATASLRSATGNLQEFSSFSLGPSSYLADGHLPYNVKDVSLVGDSNAVFPHLDSSAASPSVHQQEVSYSYSSVAGKEEAADRNEKFNKSSPFPITSIPQQHVQPSLPAPYAFGGQPAELATDISDQPLDFAPRFSRDHDSHVQPNYVHDSVGSVRGIEAQSSVHAWTPAVSPGVVYTPVPPVLPSGPPVDPSIFGRTPGPSFPSTIPSAGPPFAVGVGTSLQPVRAFPGDAFGASGIPERPKKASVPNWLREEIIKNKSVIASSAPELPNDEVRSIEDEDLEKSNVKGDQGDSKSIDSFKSTEEDEDDEDDVEAARTAAINQEIKRVLTEVLLKVTDELFDEIATKVLNEDDSIAEVNPNGAPPDHGVVTPAVMTSKASAKVLVPSKAKGTDSGDASGKSSSKAPGDVLGLGNYGSDDDEDDEIQSSSMSGAKENDVILKKSTAEKLSEDVHPDENGSSPVKNEHGRNLTDMENLADRVTYSGFTEVNHTVAIGTPSDNRTGGELATRGGRSSDSSKAKPVVAGNENLAGKDGPGILKFEERLKGKGSMKSDLTYDISNIKKPTIDDSQGRNKMEKIERHNKMRSSSGEDLSAEVESARDGDHKRQDERHIRKERTVDQNGSRERITEQSAKSAEKVKDTESRRRSSHSDVKEDKETERHKRGADKEDTDRKRGRIRDEKIEKSRHKHAGDSSRHKRRRSSSAGSRVKNSKDNVPGSRANSSSDEFSADSKRKSYLKRRDLSPSPIRSRRRQVSRSPHSKHSQRRHSPYSSLENTRARRSRSRSPVRRQR